MPAHQGHGVFGHAASRAVRYDFTYSRVIEADGQVLGVIVVAVDMMKHERAWAGLQDAVLVANSEATVILATEPSWRSKPVAEALAPTDSPVGAWTGR